MVQELSSCQRHALSLLEGRDPVFVTGGAGTGKSFLIRHYLYQKQRTRAERQQFPVLASTGAAAVIISGRTFHSFFGLGILEGGVEATVARACASKEALRRIRKAQEIVIDEVSMLSGSTFSAAEQIARKAREPLLPWGGLRVIAVGDFAQLPPVEGGRSAGIASTRNRDWAFLHSSWQRTGFLSAYLQSQQRTSDAKFLRVLGRIRMGRVDQEVSDFISARARSSEDLRQDTTRLFPRRDSADQFNLTKLAELCGDATVIETTYSGETKGRDFLRKSAPIPEKLVLKEGAFVMLRQNDPAGKFVNGSLGYLTRLNSTRIMIELLTGRLIEIERATFSYYDAAGNAVASALNFPVSLAWATTIHKSQGATIDRLAVDLRSLWEPGQAYVALSRVRCSDDLSVTGWNPKSVIVDPNVQKFYESLQCQTFVPEKTL